MDFLQREDARPSSLSDDLLPDFTAAVTEQLGSLRRHQLKANRLDTGLQRLLVTLHGLAQPRGSQVDLVCANIAEALLQVERERRELRRPRSIWP